MIISTIFIAVFILIAYFYWKHKKFVDSLPTGPPPKLFVGNLLQLDRQDPRKTFVEWHKKYGPVFTFWIGHTPNVFVTGHELMQELFVKRGDEFADRPYSFLFELLLNGKYGISNTSGDVWKEQRRFSLTVLRNFGLGRKVMEEKIEFETTKLVTVLDRILAGNGWKSVHFQPLLEICVGNIISSIVLGRTYDFDDAKFLTLKHGLDKILNLIMSVPNRLLESFSWLRFIPFYGRLGYDELVMENDKIIHFLSTQIAEHKSNIGRSFEPNDFTEAYLLEIKHRQESGADMSWFSEWQLTIILYDLWSAGMETTVNSLNWMMLLMVNHPDIQKKVQKEIDDVVGRERMPNMNDRSRMPFTCATIQELQRYANILTVNLPHASNKDVQIGGYTIPKGLTIIPHITVVHYDDTIYSNPTVFNPCRFLEDDKKTLKKSDTTLVPFSLGKRICMGEGLARMELFIIFTSLLQKFTFSCVEGEPTPDLTPIVTFTAHPRQYNVRITHRI